MKDWIIIGIFVLVIAAWLPVCMYFFSKVDCARGRTGLAKVELCEARGNCPNNVTILKAAYEDAIAENCKRPEPPADLTIVSTRD